MQSNGEWMSETKMENGNYHRQKQQRIKKSDCRKQRLQGMHKNVQGENNPLTCLQQSVNYNTKKETVTNAEEYENTIA